MGLLFFIALFERVGCVERIWYTFGRWEVVGMLCIGYL